MNTPAFEIADVDVFVVSCSDNSKFDADGIFNVVTHTVTESNMTTQVNMRVSVIKNEQPKMQLVDLVDAVITIIAESHAEGMEGTPASNPLFVDITKGRLRFNILIFLFILHFFQLIN